MYYNNTSKYKKVLKGGKKQMKKYSDGWHTVKGFEVYVENGCILRGVYINSIGSAKTTYPYKSSRYGGYDQCIGVKVETFRRSENYIMI